MSAAAEGTIVRLPGLVQADGDRTRDAVQDAVAALSMQMAVLGADADPATAMKKVEARLFALAQDGETPEGRAGARADDPCGGPFDLDVLSLLTRFLPRAAREEIMASHTRQSATIESWNREARGCAPRAVALGT